MLSWKSRKYPSIIRKKCNAMRRNQIARMLIEHETNTIEDIVNKINIELGKYYNKLICNVYDINNKSNITC